MKTDYQASKFTRPFQRDKTPSHILEAEKEPKGKGREGKYFAFLLPLSKLKVVDTARGGCA